MKAVSVTRTAAMMESQKMTRRGVEECKRRRNASWTVHYPVILLSEVESQRMKSAPEKRFLQFAKIEHVA